ncbi:hypothetical protein NEOLI_003712 [Neolecta irregularis DAH-3]|uniref:Uncharacterized protein n=1 Tax=Neolecta irregularis (strain DAH-3) TaxID=1198029 RepID=A0A1U7LJD8_NEOID|nr:hypothetical protein NEOLI_003712 [Neolecta irregularis DAH-3]|eukprot:OLL22759.1 hypothetical protein NEOLI_003712 [Neolecta irregularis DAH-3]
MFPILYLIFSFVVVLGAVDRFDQIGLNAETFRLTLDQIGFGYIFCPQTASSIEQAAIICLGICATNDFRSIVALSYNSVPCCFMQFTRILGFDQDDKTIVRFDISQQDILLQSIESLQHRPEYIELEERAHFAISSSIANRDFYAYTMALPSFPQRHNLELSSTPPNNLNIIRNIDEFETRKQWYNEYTAILRGPCWDVASTFLTPQRKAVPSLFVNNIQWRKPDIVMMIRRFLDKKPLDDSMVCAYAKATFHNLILHSTVPATLSDFDFNITNPLMVKQAFKVNNHWVIIRWDLGSINQLRAVSTGPFDEPLLQIPVIKQFLEEASKKLGIDEPILKGHTLVYTKCPKGDEAFCAIFFNSCHTFFDYVLDMDIPDDLRLWMAYDLMQRFGLTANDIDQVGIRKIFQQDMNFQKDVDFKFRHD